VFRHGNYVYLGELGGEDDFTVDVTNGPGNKVHGGSGSSYGGAHAIGDTGVIDFEVDADSMATLQVGTVLHNLASGAESAVTAIVPAAYPVVFATGLANPGTATPCLPPGFLLNPQMYFDAGHLTGGNYVVHCKTLTTVREKLQNIGATGRWKIVPNTEDRLSPAVFEMGQIKAFARAVKTGQEAYATRSGGATTHEYPSGPFTGTAQILGENLWQVTLGPTGASSAETLLVSTHGAYPAYVGQVVTFSPWALGKIVACTGNVMVLCDVSSAGRVIDDLLANGNDPLIAGTSSVSGGDAAIPGFTVDSIAHAPYLAHGGAGNKLLPSPSGLDAQYNNHYHAVATSRGGGLGAVINMANSVPLTLLTKVYSSNDPILRMYTQAETAQKLVGWQTPTAGNTGGLTRLADGILGLYDKNASTPIPLSDAGHWSLPTGVESILKALAVYPWEHNTIADELRVYDGSTMSASTKLVFPNITASHAGGAGIEKKLIVDVDYNYYRQGWVTGTKWDLANCGAHSWAFGKDVKAADNYSQAFGAGATTESVGSSVFSGVVLSDSGGSVDYPGYAQEGKWHAVARTVANDEAQLLSSGSSRFVLADESTYFIEGTIAGRSVATATKSVVMKFTIQVSTKLTEALESDRVRGTANCTTSLNAVGAGHIPGGQVVDLPQNDYGPSAAWAIGDETGAWSWDNAARLEFKWDLVSLPASPAYLDLWVRNATVAGPEVYVWSCVLHTSKIRWA
jgi:hypothetical protein